MSPLLLKKSKDTPEIELNPDAGIFLIKGNSLPENAIDFYRPVYDWINNYISNNTDGFNLDVHLNYINSSSVKLIFSIFMKLNEAYKNTGEGSSYKITWNYTKDDELMKTKGNEFSEFLDLPFEITLTN